MDADRPMDDTSGEARRGVPRSRKPKATFSNPEAPGGDRREAEKTPPAVTFQPPPGTAAGDAPAGAPGGEAEGMGAESMPRQPRRKGSQPTRAGRGKAESAASNNGTRARRSAKATKAAAKGQASRRQAPEGAGSPADEDAPAAARPARAAAKKPRKAQQVESIPETAAETGADAVAEKGAAAAAQEARKPSVAARRPSGGVPKKPLKRSDPVPSTRPPTAEAPTTAAGGAVPVQKGTTAAETSAAETSAAETSAAAAAGSGHTAPAASADAEKDRTAQPATPSPTAAEEQPETAIELEAEPQPATAAEPQPATAAEPQPAIPAVEEAMTARREPVRIGGTLRSKLSGDPAHAPELLALAAVENVGPKAKAWVARTREAYPNADADGIARLAVAHAMTMGVIGGAAAALSGGFAPATGMAASAWTQAALVLDIAAAYGQDPTDPRRAADLLVLTRVHPTHEAAADALAAALTPVEAEAGRSAAGAVRRLGMPIVAQVTGWFALRT
ncbi:MAG: hypothetical protein ACJ786_28995, partial [Catenulispora sp.]